MGFPGLALFGAEIIRNCKLEIIELKILEIKLNEYNLHFPFALINSSIFSLG